MHTYMVKTLNHENLLNLCHQGSSEPTVFKLHIMTKSQNILALSSRKKDKNKSHNRDCSYTAQVGICDFSVSVLCGLHTTHSFCANRACTQCTASSPVWQIQLQIFCLLWNCPSYLAYTITVLNRLLSGTEHHSMKESWEKEPDLQLFAFQVHWWTTIFNATGISSWYLHEWHRRWQALCL